MIGKGGRAEEEDDTEDIGGRVGARVEGGGGGGDERGFDERAGDNDCAEWCLCRLL